MIFLVLSNNKSIMEFRIEGTSILIKDAISGYEFKASKEIFESQAKQLKSRTALRRKKGEKFLRLWDKDLKKYCSFNTEEEIEEDIIKDFIQDRGWKILKREVIK